MKKGEIYEGIIEKVDFPNKGYVQVDDQKVLIKNGIPGKNVRFMIQKKSRLRQERQVLCGEQHVRAAGHHRLHHRRQQLCSASGCQRDQVV